MSSVELTDYTKDGSVDLRGRPVLASKSGKWKACAFLLVYEAFERMAFYGVSANLVTYFTDQLHEDVVSSVRNVNNWTGAVWILPTLGAYIADVYTGRFWAFTLSAIFYILGMVLLTLTTSLRRLKQTCEFAVCHKIPTSKKALFFSSMYAIAIGAGGAKPLVSTFGGDQFDDFNPRERELKPSFFNWWIFSTHIGDLTATLGIVYIQENVGWGLSYSISTLGLVFALFAFYSGTPMYRHKVRKKNQTSIAWELIRVPILAFRNRKLQLPDDVSALHEFDLKYYISIGKAKIHHTQLYSFLSKAAIKDSNISTSKEPCTVTQVEGTKLVLGMTLVWLSTLIPSTFWAQIRTLFVKQGKTLDQNLGASLKIPPASLSAFFLLSTIICLPLYDRYFVPYMRKITGNPRGITLLQRIGIGYFIQVIAIAVASAVEVQRKHVIISHHIDGPDEVVPRTIFWLLPQYLILGIGEIFLSSGMLEFFYDQSPKDMQSLGTTFFTSAVAGGGFLSSFLITVVHKFTGRNGRKSWIGKSLNNCHLEYYYALLAIMGTLNIGAFLCISSKYIYKCETSEVNEDYDQVEENNLLEMSVRSGIKETDMNTGYNTDTAIQ